MMDFWNKIKERGENIIMTAYAIGILILFIAVSIIGIIVSRVFWNE